MRDPTERALWILRRLSAGDAVSGESLTRDLEVSPRTVRRDIARLRDIGYPITGISGQDGRYQLELSGGLPPLLLGDKEAAAVAVGLRLVADGASHLEGAADSAKAALQVLSGALPHRAARGIEQAFRSVAVQPEPGIVTPDKAHQTLAFGVKHRQRLRIKHLGKNGIATERSIEPHTLALWRGRWYVFAWDLLRDDWRAFRVDRISEVSATGQSFDRREEAPDHVGEYLAQQFTGGKPVHTVVAILDAPLNVAAPWYVDADAALQPADSGRTIVSFRVDSYEWAAMMLVWPGIDFEVREPKEFRGYLRELSRRLERGAGS